MFRFSAYEAEQQQQPFDTSILLPARAASAEYQLGTALGDSQLASAGLQALFITFLDRMFGR